MNSISRYAIFIAFALSGCAGLIYESMWAHYLGLFLGHAAYAQTLTLCLFMGGMSLGAWLVSRHIEKIKNTLSYYILCELILAAFGFTFHYVFVFTTDISYGFILPALNELGASNLYKVFLSALLLLPPSILLGATFPLLSSTLLRIQGEGKGRILSTLYFSNSIGAVFGILLAVFLLLPNIGTNGSLLVAALINVGVAAICLIINQLNKFETVIFKKSTERSNLPLALLLAAAITGAASFMYEIAWIRMFSLSLGSSLHTFELVVCAFILGLALGGAWIRKRLDNIKDPLFYAAVVQIIMGIAALATMPLYLYSFDWVAHLLQSLLPRTAEGYVLYTVASYFIAIVIMLPSTFCAGIILPLLTTILINKGHGEKSIGRIYSANTLGAILGAGFATHIGMSFLGLKGLLITAAIIDAGLGIFILYILLNKSSSSRSKEFPVFTFSLVLILTVILVDFRAERLSSGVYRYARPDIQANSKVLYYKDGASATISVTENSGVKVIATNGKPDAGVATGNSTKNPDEATMLIIAALPLLLKPDAQYIANIGFGSGLTAHTLLTSKTLQQVDTIEIEPAVVEGGKHFYERNKNVYTDPRSNIVHEDARTFFASQGASKKYDAIVSEPSNPWVAGVGNLFSVEFYKHIKKSLKQEGILLQWLQLYEISPETVSSALKAIDVSFANYDLYLANAADLIIVASDSPNPDIIPLSYIPQLQKELSRVGITNSSQIQSRLTSKKAVLSPLISRFPTPSNSDFNPILSLNAPRDRFTRSDSTAAINPSLQSGIEYKELLSGDKAIYGSATMDPLHPFLPSYQQANRLIAAVQNSSQQLYLQGAHRIGEFNVLIRPQDYCGKRGQLESAWVDLAISKAKIVQPNLERDKRYIFSDGAYFKECEMTSKLLSTKLFIALQRELTERNWPEVHKISWRILDEIIAGKPVSKNLGAYALNHYLLASYLKSLEEQAIEYIEFHHTNFSPYADSVTRWLQAILVDNKNSKK